MKERLKPSVSTEVELLRAIQFEIPKFVCLILVILVNIDSVCVIYLLKFWEGHYSSALHSGGSILDESIFDMW
jgi:hypothetical protein